MKSWFSPLSSPLVVALLLCGALGITITVATVITIPTAPATHTPSLHTVIV
ncbi:MAG: hypothetical protein LBP53_00860 [Candidatus Peribacteria bacterium]|nr:hypothetical protein [Candidatus Peribacteria bacterium]